MGVGQEEPASAAAAAKAGANETESAGAGREAETRPQAAERGEEQHAETAGGLEQAKVDLTSSQALRITLLRNIRYHEDRESFYGFWDRALNFLVLLSGTAVIAAATHADHPGRLAQAIAVGTTVIGSAQLVFDISRKQFNHEKLRTSFLELLSELSDSNAEDTRAKTAKLYGEEPPTYYACDTLAFNAAMRASDRPAKYAKRVNIWRRATRHRFRYADATFPELGEDGLQEGWIRRWFWG